MPLAKITRNKKLVSDELAVRFRSSVLLSVAQVLNVPSSAVEVRVLDYGPLDINHPPIGLEIETGSGKERERMDKRFEIVKQIAEYLIGDKIVPQEWLVGGNDPANPYTWLKVFETAFVPIGYPDHTR